MTSSGITHILCDIGNVLIEADAEIAYDTLHAKSGIKREYIEQHLYTNPHHDPFCRGRLSGDEYLQQLQSIFSVESEVDLSLEIFKEALSAAILEHDPDVVTLIQQLNNNGLNIIIVTDTHTWQSEFFRERLDFDNLGERVFESHLIGKLKSDPACFPYILQQLEIKPEQALLIDDSNVNNALASKLGIQAPGYKNSQLLQKFLCDENLL